PRHATEIDGEDDRPTRPQTSYLPIESFESRLDITLRRSLRPALDGLWKQGEARRPAPTRTGCDGDNEARCSRRWPVLPAHTAGCDGTRGTRAPHTGVLLRRRRRIGHHRAATPRA